jgi:hypothetical protein
MNDDRLDHVSRAAVMLCIVVLAMIAAVLGIGIGYLVWGLLR